MGQEDRTGDGDPQEQRGDPERQADDLPDAPSSALASPHRTPLYHAQHAERYSRQELIRAYEQIHDCRLVVLIDVLFPDSITVFEELICDARPDQDLHLLLDTPGGDGETAIRLIRSAQARCREFTVIVPKQAKSAGTLRA